MAEAIRLIVGLGNPGPKYSETRHNAGFWFLEAIARKYGLFFRQEKRFSGQLCRLQTAGQDCYLLMPDTFMNHSGRSVCALASYYQIAPEEILVAHDELDLDAGVARLKRGGGHGGHNGLRDIIACLPGKDFCRLRLGVGHPGHKSQVINYVLARPGKDERQSVDQALNASVDELERVLAGDIEKAMNSLHTVT